jgi:hypothetical protein
MNIKALITTLAIIGSSSVAMARPATVSVSGSAWASWSLGYGAGPTVRDHRTVPTTRATWQSEQRFGRDYNDRYNDNRYTPVRFQTLGSDLTFGAGEYRKDIMPTALAGQFSTLKLEMDQGRTYVMKVVVEFADGTSQQQIDLDRTFRAGESLTIDLTGKSHAISRILVYRADGANVAHMNETHRGEFSVSAAK